MQAAPFGPFDAAFGRYPARQRAASCGFHDAGGSEDVDVVQIGGGGADEVDAADAGANRGVDCPGERVGLAAAPAPEEEPDAPIADRGELGVAGREEPVVRSAAAALDEPADEGFSACVIEATDGAAHGVQVGDFLTERVHRGNLRLRVECRNPVSSRGAGRRHS